MGPRKAISPIIAIIVILLITISIAGAAYSYISIYWASTTGNNLALVDAYPTGNEANLIVRNTGTSDITLGNVKILDSSGQEVSGDWTTPGGIPITQLEPGKLAKFNATCIGFCEYMISSGGGISVPIPVNTGPGGTACTDSDGGLDYYTQGTTQNATTSGTDFCVWDVLTEYSCATDYVTQTIYNCSSGGEICQAGACTSVCSNGEQQPCPSQLGVCSGCNETCTGGAWPGCSDPTYLACNSSYENTESSCNDTLDNDCDGLTDCDDSDCSGDPACGVPEGYVSWWKFDGDASDVTGINNGTLVGGVFVYDPARNYSGETNGYVLSLDGSGDYVDTNTDIVGGLTEVTISAWIKTYDGDAVVAGEGRDHTVTNSGNQFSIRISSNKLRVHGQNSSGTHSYTTGSVSVDNNKWHHLVGVYNGTNLIGYVDGIQDGVSVLEGVIRGGSYDFIIGDSGTHSYDDARFNGIIDDVMIFNRTLSNEEIQEIYNAQSYICTGITKCSNYIDSDSCVANPCSLSSGCGWDEINEFCLRTERYTWYVRPYGGNYGSENGTIYDNAWDGLDSIDWNLIEPGDTIYIAGVFVAATEGTYYGLSVPNKMNGREGALITFRGDYPGDPGIIIGAAKYAASSDWTDNGDGSYYLYDDWTINNAFEGNIGEKNILKKANSQASVVATEGSFWRDEVTDLLWYNPKDVLKDVYYHWTSAITNNGADYIKYLNLTLIAGGRATIQIDHVDNPDGAENVIIEDCTLQYTDNILIVSSKARYINITDNIFEDFPVGIYIYAKVEGPPGFTIARNIFDCGELCLASTGYGDSNEGDRGAIIVQQGPNWLIENNIILNASDSGIYMYRNVGNDGSDLIIRGNWIKEIVSDTPGYNHGIIISGSNPPGFQGYGNDYARAIIAYNIIQNLGQPESDLGVGGNGRGISIKSGIPTNPEDRIRVFNNIITNANYGLYIRRNTDEQGYGFAFQNNIVSDLNPGGYHIYMEWMPNPSDPAPIISNNLFYPDTNGDDNRFVWKNNLATNYNDFVDKAIADGVIVNNNILINPLFVNASVSNFHLQSSSPAIDNGTDVGLTRDYEGNLIPQDGDSNGTAEPDIGAYEYF